MRNRVKTFPKVKVCDPELDILTSVVSRATFRKPNLNTEIELDTKSVVHYDCINVEYCSSSVCDF